ncbi:riboflavin synthase subunit beta [Mesonia aestuariivivens]|uniref:Riboflavin synthase subunit beta n=1 Tax=Mesonia aestuariivivens TaxID=2796128 RepID=A0ABS6W1X4_9FLAO|nr:riboflavin synthase subunit beta [Mesonia aestuariivivens]MBW2961153.1 riboflavin synthase subunit beta [Mesonia aestuariivivens]
MGVLKTRKNKQFNYSPRYFDDKGEGNPYKIGSKFDQYRKTIDSPGGIVTRFKSAWSEFQDKSDRQSSRTIMIIVALFVVLFLFIIDFDLSIFFAN